MSEPTLAPVRRSHWVAITTGVLGGVLLLGTVSTAAVAGVFAVGASGAAQTAHSVTEPATGVTKIEVDVAAAKFVATCEAGKQSAEEYRLAVGGGAREWRMVRRGDTLRVAPVGRWFERLSLVRPGTGQLQQVSLSLPASACAGGNSIDAAFDVGAGELQVAGQFGVLKLNVAAGDARVEGGAELLSVDVSAGEAEFNLSGVRSANLTVAAGDLRGEFADRAPDLVDVSVSLGRADLWLPDEFYAVHPSVSAGKLANSLRTENGSAAHTIQAEVSAGDLSLQPRRDNPQRTTTP